MKLTLKLTAISLGLLLVGCGSTQNNLSKVEGEFVYPSMPILEESVFVWNENDSEALNIVKMAQPAGIGNSLRDYTDGTQASIGQIGGLSGLVDAGLGFWSSGLFTVVQGESLRAGVNNAVEFKPTIVDVVDKELVYENGKPSYKKVRGYLADKVMKAIEVEHPDIEWGGVYSLYNGTKKFDLTLVVDSEKECLGLRRVLTGEEDGEAFITRNFSSIYVDGENAEREFCSFGFNLSTPYETDSDQVVIVAELRSGAYFVNNLIDHYDGNIIVPDFYSMNSSRAVRTKYAFVSKKGEKLLFEK